MTVAASARVGGTGAYRQVHTTNDFSMPLAGERTAVSLIAPGDNIRLTGLNNVPTVQDGASFAAPHVTGTVAMLQEYANERVMAGATDWTRTTGGEATAKQHEVMKAVLMNSADKFIDDGTVTLPGSNDPIPPGNLLGMERTVLKTLKPGQDPGEEDDWFDSNSWDDSVDASTGGFIPLDEEMGTGHLNAKRALQQFLPGEQEEFGVSGGTVPSIGWDYGTTTGEDDINRYRFTDDLEAGSFISITLAWDREVTFSSDEGGGPGGNDPNGIFDFGDAFEKYVDNGLDPLGDEVINDLDIYLVPEFAGSVNSALAFSIASEGSEEHLFYQIPDDGRYEIWVQQGDADVGMNQDYGIAWWYGLAPALPKPGDFDGDGDVDNADLNQWEGDFGLNGDSDADGDGDSDGADFLTWQRDFGSTASPAASQSVPEPSSFVLFALGLTCLLVRHRH